MDQTAPLTGRWMCRYLGRMAKAKRRARPSRTSSASRPAGGKAAVGRKAPARSGAAAKPGGKTAATPAKAKQSTTRPKASAGGTNKITTATKTGVGFRGGPATPSPKRSPVAAKPKAGSSGGGKREALAAGSLVAPKPVGQEAPSPKTAAPKAAAPKTTASKTATSKPTASRTAEARSPMMANVNPEGDRIAAEVSNPPRSSETTAQGFAPAMSNETQQNPASPAGLPIPIASFTI